MVTSNCGTGISAPGNPAQLKTPVRLNLCTPSLGDVREEDRQQGAEGLRSRGRNHDPSSISTRKKGRTSDSQIRLNSK